MNPELADSYRHASAAYVHIPFCASICSYCDFAVVAGRDDLIEQYVEAVCAEIESSEAWRTLDAVYFGGGTPSHVDPGHLEQIFGTLISKHGLSEDAEVNLEANPEDFSGARAGSLREIGFNRVSFGAQSFDDAVLDSLGRRHDGSVIAAAVSAARLGGFDNVSLDLIYGTPCETDRSWRETLGRAVELEPDHVSCYALTVERGTELGRAVANGAPAPDPDTQADRFAAAQSVLREAGLERYEVSNWARPGSECRYNLLVWAQGEYLGYGNGAHGFRSGARYRNVRRIEAYISRGIAGESTRAGTEMVRAWDAELDRLFVGLRRSVGVTEGPGTSALLASPEGRALVEAGVVVIDQDRIRVARPLLTDAVHRSALALSPPNVHVDGNA